MSTRDRAGAARSDDRRAALRLGDDHHFLAVHPHRAAVVDRLSHGLLARPVGTPASQFVLEIVALQHDHPPPSPLHHRVTVELGTFSSPRTTRWNALGSDGATCARPWPRSVGYARGSPQTAGPPPRAYSPIS